MPCTEQHLAKAKRWRDENRERYQEISRQSHKKNYNHAKENNRVMKYYYYKKECERLRDILMD
jgi:hypothetical protein